MTSLSDRLSVVRPQWEAQLDAFHTLTTRALDSAEQLFALNMKTSRASIEQAAGTFHQMLYATDPRDLFAIGTQAQGQLQQVFSYSRELLGIAMGARERSWITLPLPTAPAPLQLLAAPVIDVTEQASIAIAEATTVTSEIAAAAADTHATLAEASLHAAGRAVSEAGASAADAVQSAAQAAAPEAVPAAAPAAVPDTVPADAPTELDAEKTGEAPSEVPDSEPAPVSAAPIDETSANVDALVDLVIAEDTPPAKAKPLVEALNEVVPKPASAEHPIASTVPLEASGHVELPMVTPQEATPPVKLSNGPAPSERRRASRKKS